MLLARADADATKELELDLLYRAELAVLAARPALYPQINCWVRLESDWGIDDPELNSLLLSEYH
jgi:hypothetical protein